jgi:4-hydroxybenzoate polyprenyltransferase
MRAWGRLLRLSLAPTATADVLAGICLGDVGWSPRLLLLVLASLCVYHGGMALNDWADRSSDAKVRPDRPIPSGRVAAPAALAVAVLLLVAGPVLAALVSERSAWILAGVSLAACAYDLGVRGPYLVPLCRAGNLAAGVLAGTAGPKAALLPCLAYGGYVASIAALAQLEDADPGTIARAHPGRALRVAAILLLLGPITAFHGFRGLLPAIVITALGASGLAAASRRRAPWGQAEIGRVVGLGLRRLLVFTCALALACETLQGAVVAGAILCGYPISYALRGIFPPT